MGIKRRVKFIPVLEFFDPAAATSGWLESLLSQERRPPCVVNWMGGISRCQVATTLGNGRLPCSPFGSFLFWAFSDLFATSLLLLRCSEAFMPPDHPRGHHLQKWPGGDRGCAVCPWSAQDTKSTSRGVLPMWLVCL